MGKRHLTGRVALITGASRGIGRAIACMLAGQGVKLVITARSVEDLNETKEKIIALGGEALDYTMDLADITAPAQLVAKTVDHYGGLDILINNAGVGIPNSIEDTTLKQWDLHMALNARAPFLLCKEAIPHLRKSSIPTIINIASVVGTKGYINQGAYTASKHALVGFSKVLAKEVFEDGIRVHIISPGGVATDMVTNTRPDLDLSILMSPEEIADIVWFLLTHRGNSVIDEINVRRYSKMPWD